MTADRRHWLLSASIAAALFLVTALSTWKAHDLAYCRRLIDSGDEWTQVAGLDRLSEAHIGVGADRARVERVLASVGMTMRHSPEQSFGKLDRYIVGFADPERPRLVFWALVQMDDGRFVCISTCH